MMYFIAGIVVGAIFNAAVLPFIKMIAAKVKGYFTAPPNEPPTE